VGVSAFPAAALAGWAAVVVELNQRDYGYWHTYAWLLTIFWMLNVLSAIRGLALHPRAPSTFCNVMSPNAKKLFL